MEDKTKSVALIVDDKIRLYEVKREQIMRYIEGYFRMHNIKLVVEYRKYRGNNDNVPLPYSILLLINRNCNIKRKDLQRHLKIYIASIGVVTSDVKVIRVVDIHSNDIQKVKKLSKEDELEQLNWDKGDSKEQ